MFDLPKVIVQNHISVMVLEYNPVLLRLAEFIVNQVQHGRHKTYLSSCIEDAKSTIIAEKIDVCIVGYQLGNQTAFDFLMELKKRNIPCPCIVLNNDYDAERSHDLFQAGAVDCLHSEDLTPQVLEHCIRSACTRNHMIAQYRQEISRFSNHLANMSHELKNPLNIVMGFTHRLEKELVQTSQQAYNQYFELIHRNAEHMNRLIGELLDLAKLEAASVQLYYTKFDLLQLIQHVCDDLQGMADDHSLELKRPDPQLPPIFIEADEDRMRQIVTNLASNAIKYTEKGNVSVSVSNVVADDNKNNIRIIFADTGIGIKSEEFEALFNKFETVHHKLEKQVDSTGLGLPITKELVDLHQGAITVSSEIGVGSHFEVVVTQYAPKGVTVHSLEDLFKSA